MRCDFEKANSLRQLYAYSVFFTDVEYTKAPSLFHYTNLCNKEYIIKEDCIDLRLTRADSFDDHNEGIHIIEVFSHAIESCLNNKRIDNAFYKALNSVISDYETRAELLKRKYVFCFSKNESNEYLIENYACKNNREGCVIGFQSLNIEDLCMINHRGRYPIHLFDVLYDENTLSLYIQNLICRLYELKGQDDDELTLIKRIIMNQLVIYSLAYKSSEFKREEEIRLVVDYERCDPKNRIIKSDSDPKYIHVLLETKALYSIINL